MAGMDPAKKLEDAGFNIPADQRQHLASLTADEVDTLIKIRQKLGSGSGSDDVQGYAVGPGTSINPGIKAPIANPGLKGPGVSAADLRSRLADTGGIIY